MLISFFFPKIDYRFEKKSIFFRLLNLGVAISLGRGYCVTCRTSPVVLVRSNRVTLYGYSHFSVCS